MRIINILTFIYLFLPFIALAEYNGHQIEFTIELKDGNKIHGYNYLASVHQKDKTISYQEFLEKNYELVLMKHFNDGELTYFQHRIKYNYLDYDGNTRFIYALTDKKSIDKSKIKSLKIIELTDQTYAIGISSAHNWKDRLWMSSKPIEKISTAGYLCENQIFIHEDNPKIEQIKKELEKVSIEFDKKINEQKEIMKYSNGKEYIQAEKKINELENEIDGEISELLQKFNGKRVVIITMCSC